MKYFSSCSHIFPKESLLNLTDFLDLCVDTSAFEIIIYNLSNSLITSCDPHFFKPSLPEIRVLCHETIFTRRAIFKTIYEVLLELQAEYGIRLIDTGQN
jgi:hypothetical protein